MSTSSEEIIKKDKAYHLNNYNRYPLALAKGKGAYVYDADGNKYLDFLAGIAVNSLGHAHPKIVKRMKKQVDEMVHVSNFYATEPLANLSESLVKLSGLDRAFFCNSGLEAVEAAIKFARKYAYSKGRKGNIISFENCFHGRSLASITMGKEKIQKGFGPLPEGFKKLPYNDLDALIDEVRENQPIAVILEIIQGEGGINPATKEFVQGARAITKEHDVLLITDEIQCGIGRTGKFFGYQHYGILPDIVTSAKALGNGMPIGATLMVQKVADAIEYGDHGTTYGGNPLATATAQEVVSIISDPEFLEVVQQKGNYLKKELEKAAEEFEQVTEIRGMGLMLGAQLTDKAAEVVKEMMKNKVLANKAGNNVVRMVPPLIITEKEIEKFIKAFRKALKNVFTK